MKYLIISRSKTAAQSNPKIFHSLLAVCLQKKIRFSNVENMDRKPGHLTKSVQEIAGSLFWIKVVLYFIGKGQHGYISKVV